VKKFPFSLDEIRRAEEARKMPHPLDAPLHCPTCKRTTPHRFEFVQVGPADDRDDSPLVAATSHTCLTCKQTHATSYDFSRVYPEKDLLRIISKRGAH
jgi:hypothetical protein